MYGLPRDCAENRRYVKINPEKCVGCYNCVARCPIGAVKMGEDKVAYIPKQELCAGCMKCLSLCPCQAIDILQTRPIKLE